MAWKNMSTTLDYYNENAASFVSSTVDVKFTAMQDKFLALLPTGENAISGTG